MTAEPGGQRPGHWPVEDDRDLYERAPCGYLSTLPDGTIVRVNATLLSWTGYRGDELVGRRRLTDLLTPGGRIYHESHYAPLLQMQGHVREVALDLSCADGRRLPVLLNSVLLRDSAGGPDVVRTAVFQAGDRRAYERELLLARRRAEQSEARAQVLVETLQASLLPPSLPDVEGLDLAAVYRPAGHGNQVGGDFYDVFELDDHDEWGVVIGDVAGKGPQAAAVTALVRHTTRAAAMHTRRPEQVLRAVNRGLLQHRSERFCTAAYGVVRAQRDGARGLTVASGGHPLPLLMPARGGVRPLGEPGSLLGVLRDVDIHSRQARLSAGDAVFFYTDGVTEARQGSELLGDERLAAIVEETLGGTARDMVEHLAAEVLSFQEGQTRDDIALLVLKMRQG